eukprot:GHVQ01024867.1.p1 GENE.GHVQ01024867.1~~GHVQ01024867.1.p1  ORF type:complete len:649 (-),score=78.83 GHVQ01024867.1:3899-5845(-)
MGDGRKVGATKHRVNVAFWICVPLLLFCLSIETSDVADRVWQSDGLMNAVLYFLGSDLKQQVAVLTGGTTTNGGFRRKGSITLSASTPIAHSALNPSSLNHDNPSYDSGMLAVRNSMLAGRSRPGFPLFAETAAVGSGGRVSSSVDTYLSWSLDRLAFGSCAKQRIRDHPIWKSIHRTKPSAWVWLGDSIYTSCGEPRCLEMGYIQLLENSSGYSQHVLQCDDCEQLRFLDGTWDDHDYGLNDGGKYFKHKAKSQQMFLTFLGVPKDEEVRRSRKGVYSSHLFGTTAKRQVKLILLDTRYNRDSHYVPSIGSLLDNGLFAVFAAVIRWACSFVGVGSNYNGDILGEEQWEWLESQLTYVDGLNDEGKPVSTSPAIHVIASSIQVFTGLPIVESWGHFPQARDRLFRLLKRTSPKGLVFLSGDVHYAELLGEPADGTLEVTSSGLTHSVGDDLMTMPIVGWGMLLGGKMGDTRLEPVGLSQAVYTGTNFGLLDFKWDSGCSRSADEDSSSVEVRVSVMDVDGNRKLFMKQCFNYDDEDEPARRLEMLNRVPDVIPHRDGWQMMSRGCGMGLLFWWTLQIIVLLIVLGGKRMKRAWWTTTCASTSKISASEMESKGNAEDFGSDAGDEEGRGKGVRRRKGGKQGPSIKKG